MCSNINVILLKALEKDYETTCKESASKTAQGLIYLLALIGALETLMSFSAHFQLSHYLHFSQIVEAKNTWFFFTSTPDSRYSILQLSFQSRLSCPF